MNAALVVRIRPSGPWRFGPESGSRQETADIGRSDSLFGALSSAMRKLGEGDEWFAASAAAERPELAISSAFPLLGRTHYVVPPFTLWPPAVSSPRVRWKAARFVPIGVAQDLAAGKLPAEDRWEVDARSGCLVPPGSPAPFRRVTRHSAAVDRLDNGRVEAHAASCLEFAPNAGLWMAVTFRDVETRQRWDSRIRAAFRLLADSGIGGERSNGWGHAESVEFQAGPWPGVLFPELKNAAGTFWLLSVFSPSGADEVDWTAGHYRLTVRSKRGGKAVRMAEEGSVLAAASAPVGIARNLAPEGWPHPIWRAGFAVTVPLPEVEAPRTELEIPPDLPAPPVGEIAPAVVDVTDGNEVDVEAEASADFTPDAEELPEQVEEAAIEEAASVESAAPELTEEPAAEAAPLGAAASDELTGYHLTADDVARVDEAVATDNSVSTASTDDVAVNEVLIEPAIDTIGANVAEPRIETPLETVAEAEEVAIEEAFTPAAAPAEASRDAAADASGGAETAPAEDGKPPEAIA